MVQKNLIIFLALLWITPQFMAEKSVTTRFRKTHKVNYRQEDEIVNSPHSCTSLECSTYRTSKDGEIDLTRRKRDTGMQYRHEKKEDVKGFIPKLIARPEYGTVYQYQGMLLQNLYCRYLYIVIRLPHLKDLAQKIPSFPNCDNYRICRASNPNLLNDDTRTDDIELHQWLCGTFKIHYLQEMDIITELKIRLECKLTSLYQHFYLTKLKITQEGWQHLVTKNEQDNSCSRSKRAIPLLTIA